MKHRTKVILFVIGIVVLLGVIIVLNLAHSEPGIPVETAKVDYGSILSKVSATGELSAQAQVNLQAEAMGVIKRLLVQEGSWVNKNDLLLELDRRSYEAQLVQARSRFTQARKSYARVESLYARKLVSAEQFEASGTNCEMARAQFDEAQDRYNKTYIRAPISGTVVKINVKEGETVILGTMNNPGTVIMVIADLSRMQAIVEVDETDVVSLELGQRADVEVDALPDTTFSGTVTKIGYMPIQSLVSSEVEGADFEVEVSVDSTVPEMRPGMTVSVDITTACLDSVLVVPIQAVGRRRVEGEEIETVFVTQDGKSKLKPIKTGKSSDTEVEVLEGLDAGE
ncbi:hypothetical protein CH330_06230, partial [candidate division WOR-3 bacterium JGI_Cruoil_03_51_56]